MDFEQAEMWRRLTNDPGNYYIQAAVDQREQFRKFVEELLHQGRVTVEFTKADGTVRAMVCTLSEPHGAKYNPVTESVTATAGGGNRNMNLNYMMGLLCKDTGDRKKALKLFKKIYDKDTNFKTVAREIRELEQAD